MEYPVGDSGKNVLLEPKCHKTASDGSFEEMFGSFKTVERTAVKDCSLTPDCTVFGDVNATLKTLTFCPVIALAQVIQGMKSGWRRIPQTDRPHTCLYGGNRLADQTRLNSKGKVCFNPGGHIHVPKY